MIKLLIFSLLVFSMNLEASSQHSLNNNNLRKLARKVVMVKIDKGKKNS